MFEDFFENNAPAEEENPAAERREQIRAAVMTRISRESEEKKMKHIHLRPLIIAAAVISVSTLSLATAYAAANNTAYDTIIKPGDVTIYHKAGEDWHEIKETPSDSGNPPDASDVTIYQSDSDGEDWYEIKQTPSDSGDSGNSPDASDVTIYQSDSNGEDWHEIKQTPSDSGDSGNPPDASDVTIYHRADNEWIEEIHEDSSLEDNINSIEDIIIQIDQESESGLYYRLDDEETPDEIINSMKQEIQEIERDIYIRLDDEDIPDEPK